MAFDTAFLDVMTARPVLLPAGAGEQYGRRAYGDPVIMTAYWVGGGSTTEGIEGQSSDAVGKLWAAPAAYWPVPFTREPTTNDGLRLPDGNRPTITKVTVYRDADGSVVGSELEYA